MSLHGTSFEVTRACRREVTACVEDLEAWGADVLHLHTPWVPILGWQVWRRTRIPAVATFHATLPQTAGADPVAWALQRAALYFNRRLGAVAVPSAAPLAQWREIGADPLPRIIPPAIDMSAWRAARQADRRPGPPRVVYMGRLEERKGVEVLIRAWPRVTRTTPEATLTIAGGGALRDHLAATVSDIGATNVTFLPPPDGDAARALIADADIFAAPATGGESFGLVLVEAMSAGAVPVASSNDGFATVLAGKGAGLLVPPKDADGLGQRIADVLSDPAALEGWRKWSETRALEFDIAQIGPDILSFYRDGMDAMKHRS